jgi:hypothetical protein
MNELIDFANWLWDMDKLKVNTQLPPFKTAKDLVKEYIKVKNLTIHNVSISAPIQEQQLNEDFVKTVNTIESNLKK